jgi:hypothetical protein
MNDMNDYTNDEYIGAIGLRVSVQTYAYWARCLGPRIKFRTHRVIQFLVGEGFGSFDEVVVKRLHEPGRFHVPNFGARSLQVLDEAIKRWDCVPPLMPREGPSPFFEFCF